MSGRPYGGIVSVPHAFTAEEAKAIIALGDNRHGELTQGDFSSGVTTAAIDRDNGGADWLFAMLHALVEDTNRRWFGLDLHGLEDPYVTKYDAAHGGFYCAHADIGYSTIPIAETRKLSIVIQLSSPDEYQGALLKLYPTYLHHPVTADTALGSATIFRSHIIHEVVPAVSGIRYSLVVWAKGPPPK